MKGAAPSHRPSRSQLRPALFAALTLRCRWWRRRWRRWRRRRFNYRRWGRRRRRGRHFSHRSRGPRNITKPQTSREPDREGRTDDRTRRVVARQRRDTIREINICRVVILPVENIDHVNTCVGRKLVEKGEVFRQLQIEIFVTDSPVRSDGRPAAEIAADGIEVEPAYEAAARDASTATIAGVERRRCRKH